MHHQLCPRANNLHAHCECDRLNQDADSIDVWRVRQDGRAIIFDSEPLPEELPADAIIQKTTMSRAAFYATPEWNG